MKSLSIFGRPGAALALALLLPAAAGSAEPAATGGTGPAAESAGLCAATTAAPGVLQLAEIRRIADCDQCRTSGRRAGYRQCCELVGGDYRCQWVPC